MRDPFENNGRPPRRLRLIDIDAWIDSTLYRIGATISDRFEALSVFLRRFRPTGLKRAPIELIGDGLTLGAGGGLVVLALALPAFNATNVDWRTQSDYSVTFLDRYGNEIGKRGIRHNDAVPLAELPDHLVQAVLATEDRRFFTHFGIDVLGTARALVANLQANAVVQGGSSITQQLAKNLFLTNERTLERKIKEAFLAVWLEFNLSKSEILKLYLDRAYLGGGNFGVAAATEFYFGKSVKDVSLSESAMLAGLFKAPTRYAPHINLPAARARANEVLSNMVESGMLSEGQVIAARRRPADVVQNSGSGSPDYFLDWAFDEIKRDINGGDRVLIARSTIDMNLQKAADESVEAMLRQYGNQYRVRQAALVAMEPDGAVRAMVGGRDYGESQFNRATNALRQPGSSFKPFVYTTAMMNGYTPESVVPDAPISIGGWSPRNYSRGYSGPVTLTNALVRSINTIPVRLAQAFGRDKIVDTARLMGITTPMLITRSMPLGTTEVKPLEMAAAYSVFANGGFRAKPYAFTQIITSQGDVIYDRSKAGPAPKRVLEPKIVEEMNSIMVQIPERGTGRRAALAGIRSAGKTGTTNAYRDAWYNGFTGNYVASVWFGNDDFMSTRRLTGGSLPAMTWNRFMSYAHTGIELKQIPYVEYPEVAVADAAGAATAGDAPVEDRPLSLSERTTERLLALEQLLRQAPALRPDRDGRTAAARPASRTAAVSGADPAPAN